MTTSADPSYNGSQHRSRTKRPPATPPKSSALKGASLAFSAKPRPPLKSANSYSGTNGALAAASAVGRRGPEQGGVGTIRRNGVGNVNGSSAVSRRGYPKDAEIRGNGSMGNDQPVNRGPSPSHRAALLAVANSVIHLSKPLTPQASDHAQNRRIQMVRSRSHLADLPTSGEDDQSTAILPTKSLVARFEALESDTECKNTSAISQQARGEKPRIISPTPVRPAQVRTSFLNVQAFEPTRTVLAATVDTGFTKLEEVRMKSQSSPGEKPPVPPPPRKVSRRAAALVTVDGTPVSPHGATTVASKSSYSAAPTNGNPPSNPRPTLHQRPISDNIAPLIPTIYKASAPFVLDPPSVTPSPTKSYHNRRPIASSVYGSELTPSTPEPVLNLTSPTPQLTVNSLANAMVASSLSLSLASSRAASPARRTPPILPPPRRSRPTSLFSRAKSSDALVPSLASTRSSRMNSPAKKQGLSKQTLRPLPYSDGEETTRTHATRNHDRPLWKRKHPNKHHEGDRRRWRGSITEHERKRYEGLWAANKGLLNRCYRYPPLPPPPPSSSSGEYPGKIQDPQQPDQEERTMVHPLIVADIWRRSHLPDFVLEEIWDLVTLPSPLVPSPPPPSAAIKNEPQMRRIGSLSREQFVVGTWLIDQKLTGRKLPHKVSDSVWASVRGMYGVRVW